MPASRRRNMTPTTTTKAARSSTGAGRCRRRRLGSKEAPASHRRRRRMRRYVLASSRRVTEPAPGRTTSIVWRRRKPMPQLACDLLLLAPQAQHLSDDLGVASGRSPALLCRELLSLEAMAKCQEGACRHARDAIHRRQPWPRDAAGGQT
jgi:hypothetical protein